MLPQIPYTIAGISIIDKTCSDIIIVITASENSQAPMPDIICAKYFNIKIELSLFRPVHKIYLKGAADY